MRIKIILLVITLAGLLLRTIALDKYPSGLNADEAAIGYNAYSLLTTGRDEHGDAWPIVFKSFGDYKPGGYFYLVLPFEALLGPNIWAVRLPSALLGTLAIVLVFFLARELLELSESKNLPFNSPHQTPSASWRTKYQIPSAIPLLSAFVLAISPWHIHFSRGGWEANAATTFLLAGTLFFLKSLRSSKAIYPSIIFFAASIYTYQSTRLIAPVLGISLALVFFRKLWPPKKDYLIALMLLILLLLPLVKITLTPAGMSRFAGVGLSADQGPIWRINELRGEHGNPNGVVAKILHNKTVAYLLLFGKNYLDHFNGNFLFVLGDPIERNKVPEMGQLYLIELIPLILGIIFLIRNFNSFSKVVFIWVLVAPLAAALTYQTPHALRADNMVIPITLVIASGLYWLYVLVSRNHLLKPTCLIIVGFLYLLSLSRYLHEYYVHYPQVYPAAWEYGFSELAVKLHALTKPGQQIVITDTYDQPYIEILFATLYDPRKFQKEVVLTPRDQYGFSTVLNFGNYRFGSIDWETLRDVPNTLVVGTPKEIPKNADIIDQVLFPNHTPAFVIARTKS